MNDPITTAVEFTRRLEADVQQRLGSAQLTLTRYVTLSRADDSSAPELAAQRGVSQQMASKTINELVLLGYVTATPDQDRRRRRLKVTAVGRDALALARTMNLPPALLLSMEAYIARTVS